MAARAPNKLASIIYWKNDLTSFNRVKKETRAFKKELASLNKDMLGAGIRSTRKMESEMVASRTKLAEKLRKEDEKFRLKQKKEDMRSSKSKFKDSVAGLTGNQSETKASKTAYAEMLKDEEKLHKAKLKFRQQQRKIIQNFLISNKEIRQMSSEEKKVLVTKLRQAKTLEQLNILQRKFKAEALDIARAERIRTRELKKQTFLQQRLTSSAKQMAGSYISAFAAAGTAVATVRVGQNFEAINNTMLAVSANSKEAEENLGFVRGEAYRLGISFQESSKAFARMLPARGNMTLKQTKDLFSGISEMSTLLGLSVDESGRAITALTQMMSKGQVMSEEMKQQMGEVMPNALHLMAKATQDAGLSVNGTVGELMKLMEQGKVASDVVLPHFAKRMSEAAQANGGLEKAVQSNRAAMGRLITSSQEAANSFFTAGFSEGLTSLFNTLATSMTDLQPLFKSLGRIVGASLKIISKGIQLVTTPLEIFGVVLDKVTSALGSFSFLLAGAPMVYTLTRLSKIAGVITLVAGKSAMFAKFASVVKTGAVMMTSALGVLLKTVLPLVAALTALEEVWNLFTRKKIGVLVGEGSTAAEQNRNARISATNMLGENAFSRFLDMPISELFSGNSSKRDISIKVGTRVDREGNIKAFVDSRIDQKNGDMIGNSMNNLSGGY